MKTRIQLMVFLTRPDSRIAATPIDCFIASGWFENIGSAISAMEYMNVHGVFNLANKTFYPSRRIDRIEVREIIGTT